MSAWLIVAVTAERLGVVTLPHKAKILFTQKRSWIVIASIAAFFCVFNTYIFMTYGTIKIVFSNFDFVGDAFQESLTNLTTMPSVLPGTSKMEGEQHVTVCSPGKNKYLFPPAVWVWFDLAW